MKTCGDDGGRKRDGSPCTRTPGWGLPAEHPDASRRCRDHTEDREDLREEIKANLLAHFEKNPDADVAEAVQDPAVSSSVTAVHRLRKLDPEFDEAVTRHIETTMQAARNRNVATSLYRRCMREGASAAHYALYLFNRDPDNWKDAKRIDLAGHDGGPLRSEIEAARDSLESRLALLASRVGTEDVSSEP